MGAEDAHRLAGLDEEGLVVAEVAEGGHDRVERVPGARRAPGPAVDHEVIGTLGHLGIEVVHEHPERSLLRPAAARQLVAARGAYRPRPAHSRPPTASTRRPLATK